MIHAVKVPSDNIFQLKSDIEIWLEGNAPGATFKACHINLGSQTASVNIDFVDANQLLLFKLTWGGS